MIIKICGLKTLEHSLVAAEAGAQMLGFNFYKKSVRYIKENICRELVKEIKGQYPSMICVGVFVNHSQEEIQRISNKCNLDLAQLAGDEKMSNYSKISPNAFKAFRTNSTLEIISSLPEVASRPAAAPDFLVDAYQKEAYGGSGVVGDWSIAKELAVDYDILLAGGLNPNNIASAIEQVNPWGVDVASGVESVRGQKETTLIREFIERAIHASFLKQSIGKG